ncbi:RcpC/CpaB family pilus assembly protein [Streptomyces hoynatensis]|uniref:RcpC/CpaB family pilus assembly protein n=1 Tax=Streptomyces hoynatensis TaxID=1141874 RepID=UPI001F4D98B4|nr:RcpC/CpaB family pilus assembly protein [Streptomyces hoynatensis]
MPAFAPVRPRGGRHRLRRAVYRRRRALAAALAVTAAVFAAMVAATDPRGASPPVAAARGGPPGAASGGAGAAGPPARLVSAPVRIADAAAVRLLRPGDRVDVLAAPVASGGFGAERPDGPARVVARRARVAEVPESAAGPPSAVAPAGPGEGALLVLSVPPETAAALAGAAAGADLAVARW